MLCWSATQDCENIKGAHSLQDFLLRKSRPDRYHTDAKPRARNRLGALVGRVKGFFALSFSRDARAAICFSVLLTLQPLYFSVLFICPKKKPNFSRLKGLSQVCLYFSDFFQVPALCEAFDLTGTPSFFSRYISKRQWRVGDCAIEQQHNTGACRCACTEV